jgi:hypothetical protein
MRRFIPRDLIVPALFVLASTACGDDLTTTIPTDTTPPPTTTMTFSGSINPNGAATHTFATTRLGSVTVTLSALRPDSTRTVGLSLGTWNGTACAAVIANDRATVSASILGRATSIGTLCVRIYDVGALAAPQDYEVEVVHP